MKKIVFAAALLMISASAQAGTYSYEGVTLYVQDGCRSASCVSINAPGYGSYNVGHAAKVRKARKDTAHVAAARKEDAAPAAEATPAKAPEVAASAAPSEIAPGK